MPCDDERATATHGSEHGPEPESILPVYEHIHDCLAALGMEVSLDTVCMKGSGVDELLASSHAHCVPPWAYTNLKRAQAMRQLQKV